MKKIIRVETETTERGGVRLIYDGNDAPADAFTFSSIHSVPDYMLRKARVSLKENTKYDAIITTYRPHRAKSVKFVSYGGSVQQYCYVMYSGAKEKDEFICGTWLRHLLGRAPVKGERIYFHFKEVK